MYRPFGFVALKDFKINWLSNILALSVADEAFPETRRAMTSTFLSLSPRRYRCWWTLIPKGIIRLVVSVSELITDMVYYVTKIGSILQQQWNIILCKFNSHKFHE